MIKVITEESSKLEITSMNVLVDHIKKNEGDAPGDIIWATAQLMLDKDGHILAVLPMIITGEGEKDTGPVCIRVVSEHVDMDGEMKKYALPLGFHNPYALAIFESEIKDMKDKVVKKRGSQGTAGSESDPDTCSEEDSGRSTVCQGEESGD